MGFPIRTSPDLCLVDGSPELFAVTHVLHRFLAPRHSPLALISLEKLVIYHVEHADALPYRRVSACSKMLVLALQFSRCYLTPDPFSSCATGKGDDEAGSTVRHEGETPSKQKRRRCLSMVDNIRRDRIPDNRCCVAATDVPVHQQVCRATGLNKRQSSADEALLRKEVIQPHLPVRLPCYDFTPITNPTFDGSLPKGLGHRLRVLPTFVV